MVYVGFRFRKTGLEFKRLIGRLVSDRFSTAPAP
jgi:hypothetical protein